MVTVVVMPKGVGVGGRVEAGVSVLRLSLEVCNRNRSISSGVQSNKDKKKRQALPPRSAKSGEGNKGFPKNTREV